MCTFRTAVWMFSYWKSEVFCLPILPSEYCDDRSDVISTHSEPIFIVESIDIHACFPHWLNHFQCYFTLYLNSIDRFRRQSILNEKLVTGQCVTKKVIHPMHFIPWPPNKLNIILSKSKFMHVHYIFLFHCFSSIFFTEIYPIRYLNSGKLHVDYTLNLK